MLPSQQNGNVVPVRKSLAGVLEELVMLDLFFCYYFGMLRRLLASYGDLGRQE